MAAATPKRIKLSMQGENASPCRGQDLSPQHRAEISSALDLFVLKQCVLAWNLAAPLSPLPCYTLPGSHDRTGSLCWSRRNAWS